MLSPAEQHRLLHDFNAADIDWPLAELVHERFEQQVRRAPDSVAVVDQFASLTFSQLNKRANALAWRLRHEHGVQPDTLVAVAMDRSVEMIVAILGVLKGGGAYLPLNIRDPISRIDSILSDSGCALVLAAESATATALGRDGRTLLDLSSLDDAPRDDNPPATVHAGNLAYCIYTSGSTGRPKGVLIEHGAILNRLQWMITALGFDATDVILHKTPAVFDVSVWELLLPGMIGARQVLLRPGGESDPDAIRDAIRAFGVTTIHFVPTMLFHFLGACRDGLDGLRRCICSGEALDKSLAQRFLTSRKGDLPELWNFYGPTEAAVDVCFRRIEDDQDPISIGRPAPNTRVYILDADGNLCPIGRPGELCIGGVQVGRGYLNNPELTRAAFVLDPFRAGGRMYRTGDLASWQDDGNILFHGRRDRQVKIRGFRIELEEIENALHALPGIERATVMAHEAADTLPFLCAYIQGRSCPSPSEIRQYLRSRLPEYMLPARFVHVESLPATATGKLDRDALGRLEAPSRETRPYLPPRTPLEEELAGMWQTLLHVTKVGVSDDFFDLGGDSLTALQVVLRIRERFGIAIAAASVFTHRTVDALADLIANTPASPARAAHILPQRPRADRHVLTYAQERIAFLQMLEPESGAYNIPVFATLRGPLDAELLAQSIARIAERHEILRVTFVNATDGTYQVPHPDRLPQIETSDVSSLLEDEQRQCVLAKAREVAGKAFQLRDELPLRCVLFRISDTEHRLLLVLHHIAGDAWSIRILLRELCELYGALKQHRVSQLPELPFQYIDYAWATRGPAYQALLRRDIGYWLDRLRGCVPLAISLDDRERTDLRAARVSTRLSPATDAKLKDVARLTRTTLFEIVMTALNLLLSRLTDQDDVVIGFPVANRLRVELEDIVGLFLNTLVLRTRILNEQTFEQQLHAVSAGLREAIDHQAAPFEQVVEQLSPTRGTTRVPLFNVFANFLLDPSPEALADDISVVLEDVLQPEAKFDLSFYIQSGHDSLAIDLIHREQVCSSDRARIILDQLQYILEQAADYPQRSIGSFSLVSPRGPAIVPDLASAMPEPDYPSVTDLISATAARQGDRIAIRQGAASLTYGELEERSHAIAQGLVAMGCAPGDIVAVTGPRGIGFVASMLGVFRSGATLFPLDVVLPAAHRQRLTKIAAPRVVIDTGCGDPEASAGMASLVLHVDRSSGLRLGAAADASSRSALPSISSQHQAYLFFTSGTTGTPRGVLGRHGSLSHFLLWQRDAFGIRDTDRCAQLTNASFDVMLRDTLLALIAGATLVVPDRAEEMGGAAVIPWLDREEITVLHAVPTVFQSWLADRRHEQTLSNLRWIFFAGEPLRASLVQRFRALVPEAAEIVNLYGPTETTLAKFFYRVPRIDLPPVLPVGSPLPQCQGWVMRGDTPCGVGESGEVIIRTPFRTLGYFNDAAATENAFIANPWRNDKEDRLYRTGDIGRFRPDGLLELLGRQDDQFKMNGVRIHPAAIDDALARHPDVQSCLVAAHHASADEICLVAYVVVHRHDAGLSERLRQYLSSILPAAMVPTHFVVIDRIPTTPNGKPDRRALPMPDRSDLGELPRAVEAAHTDTERTIYNAWRQVFEHGAIGVTDNFFELGGTSLKVLRLLALLDEQFPGQLRVAQLFANPTIATQAALIDPSGLIAHEVSEIEF